MLCNNNYIYAGGMKKRLLGGAFINLNESFAKVVFNTEDKILDEKTVAL